MGSIIDDQGMENIVLEHILKVQKLEGETCHLLKDQIGSLITRVLLRVNENLKNLDGIKSYDGFFYHIESMTLALKDFLGNLDEATRSGENSPVDQLFKGPRLMVEKFIQKIPDLEDNPITYERMVIINGIILKLKEHWMKQLAGDLKGCQLDYNSSEAAMQSLMYDQVREFFVEGMTETKSIIEANIERLSYFDEGKKYEGLTRELIDLLSPHIKEVKKMAEAEFEPEITGFLVALLAQLTQVYKQSIDLLKPFDERTVLVGLGDGVIHMAQVDDLLKSQSLRDESKLQALYKQMTRIREESVQEVVGIIENKVAYKLEEIRGKIIEEGEVYKALAGQIHQVFFGLVQSLDKSVTSYKTEAAGVIAAGIGHTMALKLEALGEMKLAYSQGKEALLTSLEQAIVEKKDKLILEAPMILEGVMVNNDTVLERSEKRFLDHLDFIRQEQFNYDMAFMKNDLLFELRTFEELIEYSLKKLIEIAPEEAGEMTELMIGAMEASREMLSVYGVELIIPKAHDKFEARIHEAIIAEEAHGFVKGEIIKTINIGYRKNDHTIIRASVMAAR